MKMNGERNEIYSSPKQKDKNTRDNYNIKFSCVITRYDKNRTRGGILIVGFELRYEKLLC